MSFSWGRVSGRPSNRIWPSFEASSCPLWEMSWKGLVIIVLLLCWENNGGGKRIYICIDRGGVTLAIFPFSCSFLLVCLSVHPVLFLLLFLNASTNLSLFYHRHHGHYIIFFMYIFIFVWFSFFIYLCIYLII